MDEHSSQETRIRVVSSHVCSTAGPPDQTNSYRNSATPLSLLSLLPFSFTSAQIAISLTIIPSEAPSFTLWPFSFWGDLSRVLYRSVVDSMEVLVSLQHLVLAKQPLQCEEESPHIAFIFAQMLLVTQPRKDAGSEDYCRGFSSDERLFSGSHPYQFLSWKRYGLPEKTAYTSFISTYAGCSATHSQFPTA